MLDTEPLTIGDRVTLKHENNVGEVKEVDEKNSRVLIYWGRDREMEARIWEPMFNLVKFTEPCLSPEEVIMRQAPDKLFSVAKDTN